jgi:uncharacterized protein YbcI
MYFGTATWLALVPVDGQSDSKGLPQAIGRRPSRAGGRRIGASSPPKRGGGSIPDQSEGPEDPQSPEDRRDPPTDAEVLKEISSEILRIHEESYGAGATKAHAYVGNGFVVVVLDDIDLLPNEKFLIDSGKSDTVLQVRTQYQNAIQASFRAAIERATGRTVVGFASTTSVEEPRFMAEVFKLE